MGDGTAQSPQTGAGQYWSSNGSGGVSNDLVTSAKSYIPEMAWNDTTFSHYPGAGLSAGGGGVSALMAQALVADWSAWYSGRWESRCAGHLTEFFPGPRRLSLLHPGTDRGQRK